MLLYNLNHYGGMKLGLNIFRTVPQSSYIRKLPQFYQEILSAWRKISVDALLPPNNRTDILHQPLFHNPFILDENQSVLYNKDFIEGEFIYVGDICYEMIPYCFPAQEIYDIIVALNPYSRVKLGDIDNYLSHILHCIPQSWCDMIISQDKIVSTQPVENLLLRLKSGDSWVDARTLTAKCASLFLRCAIDCTPKGQQYWYNLYPEISFKNRWNGVDGGIKANIDADLDFKILHNILYTNDRLYKYKMIDSPLCSLCNLEVETVHHLFIHCPRIHNFWTWLTSKLKPISSVHCWEEATLLGLDLPRKNYERVLIDFLFNSYKTVIWSTRIAIAKNVNRCYNIDIPLYYHNSLKKKINLIYHYYSKRHEVSKFWGIFDQGESPIILLRHDEGNYTYIFDW